VSLEPLRAYFEEVYPSRESSWGKWLFRRGQSRRLRLIREWLPDTAGLSILDAGCGDGETLAAALGGRPACIRLEDISARAIREASHRLTGGAGRLSAGVMDATMADAEGYDVVLAIGIFEYQADLAGAVATLLRRTEGVLIGTVSARHHPRNWLRKLWLLAHGVDLRLAGRSHVEGLARSFGLPCQVQRCRYDWFFRIEVEGGAERMTIQSGADAAGHPSAESAFVSRDDSQCALLRPAAAETRASAPGAPPAAAPPRHVFTVDLEDWYHGLLLDHGSRAREDRLLRGTVPLLRILAEHSVAATFFVLGPVARQHPGLVRRIAAAGHEIGCHGWSHNPLHAMEPARFASETCTATDVIADTVGQRPVSYRAAHFSITRRSLWALEVLASLGYRCDSSIFPVRGLRYGIPGSPIDPYTVDTPSGPIREVPLPVRSFLGMRVPVSGGAYLRLYPYFVTRANFLRVQREARQVVFYVHPWELDPGHPRLSLPWQIRFTRHANLASTAGKLRRLLADFRFGPIGS
jgi:polysaccharide deacetylase family protein (PEP-CTERM system associated)